MSSWARWVGFSNHINPTFFWSPTNWMAWRSTSTSSCTISTRTWGISFCYNVNPTCSGGFTHHRVWRTCSRLGSVSGRAWGVSSGDDIHPTFSRRFSHWRTPWAISDLWSIFCGTWRVSFGNSINPRSSGSLAKRSRSFDMIKLTLLKV